MSAGSLYVAKQSYDLSVLRDERELAEKLPAIDIQMRPAGVSTLAITIAVTNRAEFNITPIDITALHSFETGSLYLADDTQSIDKLSSTLSLSSMGSIPSQKTVVTKATLTGVTDGKYEQFSPGLELAFLVRVRLADQQDTIQEITLVRRILAPTRNFQPDPTPQIFLDAIMRMKEEQKNKQLILYSVFVLVAGAAPIALLFYLRRRRVNRTESRNQENAQDNIG